MAAPNAARDSPGRARSGSTERWFTATSVAERYEPIAMTLREGGGVVA